MKKHIAMWSCPRSRSTLLLRSFEQRGDCLTFDEPFYPPYLLNHGLDHPYREEIISNKETDYEKVIDMVTAELPTNIAFSFQKHIAKNILPEYGREWLSGMTHFFLIRPAKEVIASYYNVNNKVDLHDTGFLELQHIFDEVKRLSDARPIVIDSNEILENPEKNLKLLCSKLGIDFSDDMLSWGQGLQDSNVLVGGSEPLDNPAEKWHSSLINSTGFMPYKKKDISLPEHLYALEQECDRIYNELSEYKIH